MEKYHRAFAFLWKLRLSGSALLFPCESSLNVLLSPFCAGGNGHRGIWRLSHFDSGFFRSFSVLDFVTFSFNIWICLFSQKEKICSLGGAWRTAWRGAGSSTRRCSGTSPPGPPGPEPRWPRLGLWESWGLEKRKEKGSELGALLYKRERRRRAVRAVAV